MTSFSSGLVQNKKISQSGISVTQNYIKYLRFKKKQKLQEYKPQNPEKTYFVQK